jgi:hypothetical protein
MRDFAWLSLAKTRAELLSFTPLTMLRPSAQAVDFKVGRHFGEGQGSVGAFFFPGTSCGRLIEQQKKNHMATTAARLAIALAI